MTDQQQEQPTQDESEFDISSASIADLEKRLNESKSEPQEQEDESSEVESSEDQKEANGEAEVTRPGEKPVAPTGPQAKKQVESNDPAVLNKRVHDKEQFIQRQAYEIGKLRKAREELEAKVKELGQKVQQPETPEELVNNKFELRDAEQRLRGVSAQEERAQARALVQSTVEPEEGLPEAMLQCLNYDGLDQDYVSAFQTDPFSMATGPEIVQIAQRAKGLLREKKLYDICQQLLREREELKKKPEALLDKVDRSLRGGPSVPATNGRGAANPADLDSSQLDAMSLDDLYGALKSARIRA